MACMAKYDFILKKNKKKGNNKCNGGKEQYRAVRKGHKV